MPKKHRAISGVGASSILDLKDQLYKSQEESKRSKAQPDQIEYQRAKKIIGPRDPLSQKNSGVEARAHKDKLELKAVKDGSVSYAALERKAELYDKLKRGEIPDEENNEKYCVDFFQKSLTEDITNEPRKREDGDIEVLNLQNTKPATLGRAESTLDNNEHIRFVREVNEETNEARHKTTELKLRRQEQVAAHREKLKQAYLRKKLEKLRASSQSGQT
ncbi:uncharacterized protein At4g18257-like [Impatiens glandulifera]|uniref:uncharacterized protein At4g18257-like n=1 Tax=Impatiens glandulifera TaxID=253017 RepID=UPI001FB19985|nr:uncharacterized protein At4g18257-like [Impatiens glandulifera]